MKIAADAPINEDGTSEYWDLLPRCPYQELPASLQKSARQRFTIENLRNFLQDCYTVEEWESLVSDLSAECLDKILLRARNTAVYTIEKEIGEFSPMLYGDHAVTAFEAAISNYENAPRTEKGKKARISANKAARGNQLVSAGYYQIAISDKKYKFALTTKRNKSAYIQVVKPGFFEKLDFTGGVITWDREVAGVIRNNRRGSYEDIQDIDPALLTQIYTAAVKAHKSYNGYTITLTNDIVLGK